MLSHEILIQTRRGATADALGLDQYQCWFTVMECEIGQIGAVPQVAWSAFLTLSTAVLLANIITIIELTGSLTDKVRQQQNAIRANYGKDKATGIPFATPRRLRRILEYSVSKRVQILVLCFVCSLTALGIYYVAEFVIEHKTPISDCVLVGATYLGLAPVLVAVVVALEFVYTFAKLYTESSRQEH